MIPNKNNIRFLTDTEMSGDSAHPLKREGVRMVVVRNTEEASKDLSKEQQSMLDDLSEKIANLRFQIGDSPSGFEM